MTQSRSAFLLEYSPIMDFGYAPGNFEQSLPVGDVYNDVSSAHDLEYDNANSCTSALLLAWDICHV